MGFDRKSTPRPIRFNDALWVRFQRVARHRHTTAAALIRQLMEEICREHEERSYRRFRPDKPDDAEAPIDIEL